MHPPALAVFLAASALLAAACAPPVPGTAAPSVGASIAGYYEGTFSSRVHGEVAVETNLLEAEGAFAGTLFTPLGDFPVSAVLVDLPAVTLRFVVGDGDVGTISGQWVGGTLHGTWALSDDGGPVSLRRLGPPRAPTDRRDEPTLELPTDRWREDLHHLAAELPRAHGNAFHATPRAVFEDSVRALDARLETLAGHEVFAAMGRLVALVGDGHTYLQLPGTFHRYPLRLYAFRDTLRVTHAPIGYEHLLGGRVVAIGGMEIAEAEGRVRRQIAHAENEHYVRREAPFFLTLAETLHAHEVVPQLGAAEWRVATVGGEMATVRLNPVPPGEPAGVVSGARAVPLARERPGEDLWFAFLPGTRTLYVNFSGYPPRGVFHAFFTEVFAAADRDGAERLVIDLRRNPGGDFNKGRDLLLPPLKAHRLNRRGCLFVAIGRHTFSAAMTNAADLLNETEATLVGEPTGARPNGWQEKGSFVLPNSRLTVSVSTRYYRFLDDDLPAVMPHQHVEPTWEEFRDGRDTVLDWIVGRPSPCAP